MARGWRNGGSFREECCWKERYKSVKKEQKKLECKLIGCGILLKDEIDEIKKDFLTLDNTKYHNYFKDIFPEYLD